MAAGWGARPQEGKASAGPEVSAGSGVEESLGAARGLGPRLTLVSGCLQVGVRRLRGQPSCVLEGAACRGRLPEPEAGAAYG